MWISRKKWQDISRRIDKCEKAITEQKEDTSIKIRVMAKRILEQPEELREEINGIEDIERFIQDFIHS